MFESAELGRKVDKATYDREEPNLRVQLLDAQYDLLDKPDFPVVIVIGGVDGAGKGETVNLLNEWMDPRYIRSHAVGDATDEERERPPMWRFWRDLPPKGRIGIFFGSWYTAPIVRRVMGKDADADLDQHLQEVVRFERMLADEGALVLKFWFHLSKKDQRKRLKALEKDARTRWRVTPLDWERFERYDDFRRISERALRHTDAPDAPWIVVEGVDRRYRSLTVGRAILTALRRRLDQEAPPPDAPEPVVPETPAASQPTILQSLDLSRSLARDRYDDQLEKYQGRLNLLSRHPKFRKVAVMAVFEGSDAAGKGGAIRRVTAALDARQYRVIPIAAPTQEERAQPYLWRFWRYVPKRGQFAIFDRSWYGRVLVERVEGFCSPADWKRAYGEINDFEDQLARGGIVLAKFYLTTSKEEQLRRFQEREQVAFKHFKITSDDWRNREQWDQYEAAVVEMVERTGGQVAPWTLVEANDKRYARIKVLKTLCERIEAALD